MEKQDIRNKEGFKNNNLSRSEKIDKKKLLKGSKKDDFRGCGEEG